MSSNPYQAPQASLEPTYQYERAAPMTVAQILFSMEGRIPRRVYWAASILSGLVIGFVGVLLMVMVGIESEAAQMINLAMNIPSLIIGIFIMGKRWHDRGKSAWWNLILLIPLIGAIWTFIECGCLRGTVGPNQYGADPT